MTSVLHISHADIAGGAALAAYRLHSALAAAGVETRMIVGHRVGADGTVSEVDPATGVVARGWRMLDAARLAAERRRSARKVSDDLEYFSDDRVPGPDPLAALPAVDVVHLHWVANLVDWRRFFAHLPHGQPVVWTLHDMNPFTGGCHYSMGCERYLDRCGACPLLGSPRDSDLTRRIFARKAAALTSLNRETTRIVAPSTWLAEEARRSRLLGGFDIDVIPNGIDTDVFRPRDRRAARDVFGLPQDRPVLMFVADQIGNRRKGFDLLQAALARLPQDKRVVLAAIGARADRLPGEAVAIGRIESERLMSLAYSAANVFVLPTRSDNLPNVLLEALACGLPLVSFDVGGIADVVRPGKTGELAAAEDPDDLAQAILRALDDGSLEACDRRRQAAVKTFSGAVTAHKYAVLYQSLISLARARQHLAHAKATHG